MRFLFFPHILIYFWLCWVFVAVRPFSPVMESGGCSLDAVRGPLLPVASLVSERGLQGAQDFSSGGSRALEHRLSSCGTRAQLLCGMWDLPGSGIEPTSLALAG